MGSQPIRIQLGKILREILWDCCEKLLQEIVAGKSCGKILRENLMGNAVGNSVGNLVGNSVGNLVGNSMGNLGSYLVIDGPQ